MDECSPKHETNFKTRQYAHIILLPCNRLAVTCIFENCFAFYFKYNSCIHYRYRHRGVSGRGVGHRADLSDFVFPSTSKVVIVFLLACTFRNEHISETPESLGLNSKNDRLMIHCFSCFQEPNVWYRAMSQVLE